MTKLTEQLIKYNAIRAEIAEHFVKTFDFGDYEWIDKDGGIFSTADMTFDIEDAITYLKVNPSEELLFESYEYFYNCHVEDKAPGINLENYLMYPELREKVKERDNKWLIEFDKLRFSPKGCSDVYWNTRGDDVAKSQIYWEAIKDCIKIIKQK